MQVIVRTMVGVMTKNTIVEGHNDSTSSINNKNKIH